MKASGLTKSVAKKWGADSLMEQQNATTLNGSRSSRSVVQVDEEIHFIVDSNGLANYSTVLPNEKSIELSRKTYSKKNPIVCSLPQNAVGTFSIHHLPMKSKSQPSSPAKYPPVSAAHKSLQKKRKTQTKFVNAIESVPKKLPKRNLHPKFKSMPQSCSTEASKKSRNKLSTNTETNGDYSSDSDIEILEVKLHEPVSLQVSKAVTNDSFRKFSSAQANKRRSKYFENEENHNEAVMNEADIAPTMPSNPDVFPDGRDTSNSMHWLSASNTVSVPSFDPSSFVEKPSSATKSSHVPQGKQTQIKASKKSRELDSLYKNLDEISWTHEKSFKNLLRNPDYIRHSERNTVKVGKNLRKLKEAPIKKSAAFKTMKKTATGNSEAQQKSNIARLSHSLKAKSILKNRMPAVVRNIKSRNVRKQVVTNDGKKKTSVKVRAPSLKEKVVEDTDALYMLNPDGPKPKLTLPKGKPTLLKAKPPKTKLDKPKVKFDLQKIKTEAPKAKSSVMKLKPDGPKAKSSVFKLCPDTLKGKPDVTKLKSFVAIKKPLDSPPSTSGLQRNGCSSKQEPNILPSKHYNRTSDRQNTLPDYDNSFSFPTDMQMLQNYLGKKEDLYSAFQNASTLRVRLQPLEHTKLWTAEFYEEFRKHFLEQAFRRAVENRDTDSSNMMYHELLESFMNSKNPTSNNANRVMKRKRPEEEALRSSARQSEGAFRYKEIVVKKHPNYMQVVLVPNDVKQNSLTVDAMKELKDAFLLAKKDPNCRAVLLNSSGPYFCTGIDLAPLVGSNKKQAAEDISNSIRDLVMTLGMFTKPVVAAVNGVALGFGVSLLTYCDVVLASDKATFCLPSAKIGYIPEGGITLTLPQAVGSSVASEMFLQGRRLTAEQACACGLVSEVIWPTRLMNEVIPRLERIISQPLLSMEATKTLVRCNLLDKLKGHVDRERRLLCEHWLSAHCQSNIKRLLQTGWLLD